MCTHFLLSTNESLKSLIPMMKIQFHASVYVSDPNSDDDSQHWHKSKKASTEMRYWAQGACNMYESVTDVGASHVGVGRFKNTLKIKSMSLYMERFKLAFHYWKNITAVLMVRMYTLLLTVCIIFSISFLLTC